MKLQTQFTVSTKSCEKNDVSNRKVLEGTFKRECQDYPTKEDCLVCCN